MHHLSSFLIPTSNKHHSKTNTPSLHHTYIHTSPAASIDRLIPLATTTTINMDAVVPAAATGGAAVMAMATTTTAVLLLLCAFIYSAWLSPSAARRRLRAAGFDGPRPCFPFGNLPEITASSQQAHHQSSSASTTSSISNDIHGSVFPYFARWRSCFGKVFVYWLGTEPFLYVSDPSFLRSATAGALGKRWGKPDVFRRDRMPMFGRGLVMAEGDEWARHRHIIAPAFSASNLNDMIGVMQETTEKMLSEWADAVEAAGEGRTAVVDVERGVVRNAAEIIARASFGVSGDGDDDGGARVFAKLQAMQAMLFQSNRLVGVPLARLLHVRKTYEAWRLGREIDALLVHIIDERRRRRSCQEGEEKKDNKDLLSLLLAGAEQGADDDRRRRLTTRELVDECKTFFFGGHETTALALSWTLLMLAEHPNWQEQLREEVFRELGNGHGGGGDDDDGDRLLIDATKLGRLTKMGWVMNEVLRLYPPSPNVQRQALQDVDVTTGDDGGKSTTTKIPRGTNMWVDVVAMHHDEALWGGDAHEFRPERWQGGGGCAHRMGYLPFGFGGRVCVGRNLTGMEYRVVLAMLLRRFRLGVATEYVHRPKIMLSLRPSSGIQLRLTPLAPLDRSLLAAS